MLLALCAVYRTALSWLHAIRHHLSSTGSSLRRALVYHHWGRPSGARVSLGIWGWGSVVQIRLWLLRRVHLRVNELITHLSGGRIWNWLRTMHHHRVSTSCSKPIIESILGTSRRTGILHCSLLIRIHSNLRWMRNWRLLIWRNCGVMKTWGWHDRGWGRHLSEMSILFVMGRYKMLLHRTMMGLMRSVGRMAHVRDMGWDLLMMGLGRHHVRRLSSVNAIWIKICLCCKHSFVGLVLIRILSRPRWRCVPRFIDVVVCITIKLDGDGSSLGSSCFCLLHSIEGVEMTLD